MAQIKNCRNFPTIQSEPVASQVDRLIRDAQRLELLSQHYTGWCPFW